MQTTQPTVALLVKADDAPVKDAKPTVAETKAKN